MTPFARGSAAASPPRLWMVAHSASLAPLRNHGGNGIPFAGNLRGIESDTLGFVRISVVRCSWTFRVIHRMVSTRRLLLTLKTGWSLPKMGSWTHFQRVRRRLQYDLWETTPSGVQLARPTRREFGEFRRSSASWFPAIPALLLCVCFFFFTCFAGISEFLPPKVITLGAPWTLNMRAFDPKGLK